jgi:hypothetical protein
MLYAGISPRLKQVVSLTGKVQLGFFLRPPRKDAS